MKIIDAIGQIDALMHNTYSQGDKIKWLDRLDNMVKRNIIDTHAGGASVIFSGYGENTDPETELLIPEPFDEAYMRWMEAQIHYFNGEYDKYNNAILMFNTSYEAYADFYNRNHTPVHKGRRFLF